MEFEEPLTVLLSEEKSMSNIENLQTSPGDRTRTVGYISIEEHNTLLEQIQNDVSITMNKLAALHAQEMLDLKTFQRQVLAQRDNHHRREMEEVREDYEKTFRTLIEALQVERNEREANIVAFEELASQQAGIVAKALESLGLSAGPQMPAEGAICLVESPAVSTPLLIRD